MPAQRMFFVAMLLVGSGSAAPMLRLETSALVIQILPGSPRTTQSIAAHNQGDGTLSLGLSVPPSITWLTASVGGNACADHPPLTCIPLQFSLDASNLARGIYTARVTVSDPHAIDSPQDVTVTVRVGARLPTVVDEFITPGSAQDVLLDVSTGTRCAPIGACPPSLSAHTDDGGKWLSVVVNTNGTFRSNFTTRIHLSPPADMKPGVYQGGVEVTNSFDDGTVPITMRVTTQPIAIPSQEQFTLRLAQGGPAMTYPYLPLLSLSNGGSGTLELQSVSATGAGVSVDRYGDFAIVRVNPGSLAPGLYNNGRGTLECNGGNCPVEVPVTFEVAPRGSPMLFYQGVVDNATYLPGSPVAPGDVAIARGEQLSRNDPASSPGSPLARNLGGTTVLVNGHPAPLFYSSSGQVGFQVPTTTTPGAALVQVVRDGDAGNTISVTVAERAPQIVKITDLDRNSIDSTHPARTGQELIVWAIGLGPTSPAVPDGVAAPGEPAAVVTVSPAVIFGRFTATPSSAILSPGSVGLYELLVAVPNEVPPGPVYVSLFIPDKPGAYSYLTEITIK